MSALTPKADIPGRESDVRFVPIGDIGHVAIAEKRGALRCTQLGAPIQHHAEPIAGLDCGDGNSVLGGQSDGKAQRRIGFEPTTTFKVLQGRELVSRYILAKEVAELKHNLYGLCHSYAT